MFHIGRRSLSLVPPPRENRHWKQRCGITAFDHVSRSRCFVSCHWVSSLRTFCRSFYRTCCRGCNGMFPDPFRPVAFGLDPYCLPQNSPLAACNNAIRPDQFPMDFVGTLASRQAQRLACPSCRGTGVIVLKHTANPAGSKSRQRPPVCRDVAGQVVCLKANLES